MAWREVFNKGFQSKKEYFDAVVDASQYLESQGFDPNEVVDYILDDETGHAKELLNQNGHGALLLKQNDVTGWYKPNIRIPDDIWDKLSTEQREKIIKAAGNNMSLEDNEILEKVKKGRF